MTTTTTRLIILNTVFSSAVAAAWQLGYVGFLFGGDKSMLSYVIAAVLASSLTATMLGKDGRIADAAAACAVLGFIGTLVGFLMGMTGVGDLSTTEGLIAAGNSLFSGMSTAFNSTLTGVIAGFWLCVVGMVVGVRAW